MEKNKLKMEVANNEEKISVTALVNSEDIKIINELHGINVVDDLYEALNSVILDKVANKKEDEIKIRINTNLKKDFQNICENEGITMSNKINQFIIKEVNLKKVKTLENRVITQKLIKFGVMNGNGRLYLKNSFTDTKLDDDGLEITEIERLNRKTLYGQYGHPEGDIIIHKYNATHSITNIRINDDWLMGDITVLNDSIIPILDKLVFRPRSYGIIDENGTVKDLETIGFDAILISEDKFII